MLTPEEIRQCSIRSAQSSKEGRIELLERIDISEGTEVLVTPLIDEADFWLKVSQPSIDAVWKNEEDDVYAELLV
jgi:hypothetical protein